MLPHLITLQWRDTARNDLGEQAGAWVNVLQASASHKRSVGVLPEQQGQEQELVSHIFRIRYRAGLSGVTRVLWRGVPYDLTTPMVDPDGRQTFLELTCQQRAIESTQPFLVDFTSTAFEANEKSQLGWSSNAVNTDLVAALPKAWAVGLRGGSLNVEFDTGLKTMDWSKTSLALTITSFAGDGRPLTMAATPSAWFTTLQSILAGYRQQLLVQATGATPAYQQPLGTKPAAHPVPTNMAADGALVAGWLTSAAAGGVLTVNNGNEPGHTRGQFDKTKNAAGQVILPNETSDAWELRRSAQRTLDEASEVEIYTTHLAPANLGPYGRKAMASSLWGDVKDGKKLDTLGRNFFTGQWAAFQASGLALPGLFTINSFNSKWWGQTAAMAAIIGPSTAPFVATQWCDAVVKVNSGDGGSDADGDTPFPFTRRRSAAATLNTLAALCARDDIEAFHASYWVGAADKAFLLDDGTELPRYTALKWWQQVLPTRRVRVHGLAPYGLPATDDQVYAQANALYGGVRPVVSDDVFAVAGLGATATLLVFSMAGQARTLTPTLNGLPEGTGPFTLQRLNEDGTATTIPYTGTLEIEAGGVLLLSAPVAGAVDDATRRGAMASAQLLATRIHCERGADGLQTIGRARYCAVRDVATLGLRQAGGEVATTAAWSNMPATVQLQPQAWNASAGLLGLRVDFGEGFVPAWSANPTSLPASVAVDLEAIAPGGWAAGTREATLQLYLATAGAGAVAQILLEEA
jgi:SPP1 family predicted phage head-tail adaptor